MTDQPLASAPPPAGDASTVEDQWSAVINCHGCNLQQIEVAIAANSHDLDPHPADGSRQVRRHPIYLVAEDYSQLDEQGRPTPGKPTELDLAAIRGVFSARHPEWVSPDGPPADGSFVRVRGMFYVAERDSAGNPTGRVRLGNPEDVPAPAQTGA